MERLAIVVVLSVALFVFACSGDANDATRPGVNSFGQRTEDLARVAAELTEALAAVEATRAPGLQAGTASRAAAAAAEARLEQVMETIRLPERMRFFSLQSTGPDARTPRLCRLCHAVAGAVVTAIRVQNRTGPALASMVDELCIKANVTSPHICTGMIDSNTPIVEYIVRNTPGLDSGAICGTFMPECADGVASMRWALNKDMGAKPPGQIRSTMLDLKDPPPPVEPYRVLQITDYHWDSEYSPDGNANCGEPTCCRKNQGAPPTPEDRAGRWGDYRSCDIPWETVEEFIKHTQEKLHNVDLIYFTGDVVDHGVWETSREKNEYRIRYTFRVMKESFGDTLILPLVGNHEPHPLNIFAPDYITDDALSTRWLYEVLADEWITHWLPEDTRATILKGGYYTVLVRPGFRVVALNNMYCYTLNWWVLHDPVDPSGQLAWLIDVLLAAEAAKEKVHILAHIPPGNDDCLESWGREFAKIVDRFSATISAQFNGHTHVDDLSIFYDEYGRPNNVAFNGGSLTTYADVNPNYKLYLVDGNHEHATWNVLDAELWGFNLTKANENPDLRPEWYRMYSFKETFNVESLHPFHLDKFIGRLTTDNQLLQQYYWYHMLDSDVGHLTGCDQICAERLICNSVTTITNEIDQCERYFKTLRAQSP
ncbi:sphingomyelin phosphodiesterase-like [Thrips palmi]|uniref:Sphingomyelin phosphodiesterase n=1 Tax=Thrips palmi TaxID=161013 RepID=A0A6P9AHH4_THRPL|nr:sphingomyelin phosphodiesterase-like [Thrips palmi]